MGIEAWVETRRAFDIGLNKEPARQIYKIQRYTGWWGVHNDDDGIMIIFIFFLLQ